MTFVNLAIWGMHRSGTSLLCSLLAECGVHFGETDQLIPPNQENPNGFWENIKVRELNDALLMAMGCDWDHISHFDSTNIAKGQLPHFTEESTNILDSLGNHPISGIKEPRMCILVNAWGPILKNSVDIFVYRHPAEIAKSLYMRNGIPYDIGLCLCEYYLVHLLNYLSSRDIIAVSHQDLLQSPVQTLENISKHIHTLRGVSPLVISDRLSNSVVDMNYYRARWEQEKLPDPLEFIWSTLQQKLPFPRELSISEKSISLLTEYDRQESESAFLAAKILRNENRAQEDLLGKIGHDYQAAKAEIDLLHKNVNQQNSRRDKLLNELLDAHNALKEKNSSLQEKNNAIKEKNSALQEKNNAIKEKNSALQEKRILIAQQKNALEERAQLIEKNMDALEQQTRRLGELEDINRGFEKTLITSDTIVEILTSLNVHLAILTGRISQLSLSAVSVIARLLGISRFKDIDKKLMALPATIKVLTERYESERALGKKHLEQYEGTDNIE